jgi:hypothetical protein
MHCCDDGVDCSCSSSCGIWNVRTGVNFHIGDVFRSKLRIVVKLSRSAFADPICYTDADTESLGDVSYIVIALIVQFGSEHILRTTFVSHAATRRRQRGDDASRCRVSAVTRHISNARYV